MYAADCAGRVSAFPGSGLPVRCHGAGPEELAKVLAALATGVHIEPSKMLLAGFLRTEWLPAVRPTIRPTTFASYETHVERHIILTVEAGGLVKVDAL